MLLQALAHGNQVRAFGLQGHSDAVGTKQLKYLQRRQVGGCFKQNLGAFVDVELGRKVQRLLRTTDHHDLTGIASNTQGAGVGSQRFAQRGSPSLMPYWPRETGMSAHSTLGSIDSAGRPPANDITCGR